MNEKNRTTLISSAISLAGGALVAFLGLLGGLLVQDSKEDHEAWKFYMENMTKPRSIEAGFEQLSILVYMDYNPEAMPHSSPEWIKTQFCSLYHSMDSRMTSKADRISKTTAVRVLRDGSDVENCEADPEACSEGYRLVQHSDALHDLFACYQIDYCPDLKERKPDKLDKLKNDCEKKGIL